MRFFNNSRMSEIEQAPRLRCTCSRLAWFWRIWSTSSFWILVTLFIRWCSPTLTIFVQLWNNKSLNIVLSLKNSVAGLHYRATTQVQVWYWCAQVKDSWPCRLRKQQTSEKLQNILNGFYWLYLDEKVKKNNYSLLIFSF